MSGRGKEIISFMDLNPEDPAQALPQACSTPSSPTQTKHIDKMEDDKDCKPPALHRMAKRLLSIDPYHQFEFELPAEGDSTVGDCIKIVCISDTMGQQASIPDGDVLIHAGNLTQHGTFVEVQTMLDWLNSLPHCHKILVAGNHDMILDQVYCSILKENGYSGDTAENLNWGNVIYLQDTKKVIDVWIKKTSPSVSSTSQIKDQNELSAYQHRRFVVFGTPWTASPSFTGIRFYSHSAFQTNSTHLVWSKIHDNRIPSNTNILVAHGPPKLHGDSPRAPGSSSMLREIHRVKPWLVVTGHYHRSGDGLKQMVETVVLDSTRISYERIMEEKSPSIQGWARLTGMACRVVARTMRVNGEKFIRKLLLRRRTVLKVKNLTTFVNASVCLQDEIDEDTSNGREWKSAVFFMKPEYEIEY